MAGRIPEGPTLIYDDEHYYMGGAIAEKLLGPLGVPVVFATPETTISAWGERTVEQYLVHKRLIDKGAKIITTHNLEFYDGAQAILSLRV